MKDQILAFADDHLENTLLFGVEGDVATEVTHRGLEFLDDGSITPLFENTQVTKPIPVMVEGEYAVLNRATKEWQKVRITAEDIQEYLHNTPRDVAVNYEHRRGGTAKGWVRLKDTGRVGKIQTRNGEKTALFSSLELYDQAAADVRAGYFRDVSIELKPISKEVIGCALTSTPVMRDLQFYSNVIEEEPEETGGSDTPVDGDAVPAVEETETEEHVETPSEDPNPTKETTVTPEQKQAAVSEFFAEFGLTPESFAELVEDARKAKLEGRLNAARQKATEIATAEDGKAILAPAGIEALAQLYMFAEDNASDELVFSIDGVEGELTATGLVEEVFKHVQAVQLFGMTEGVSAEDIEPNIPTTGESGVSVDDSRVADLIAVARSTLGITPTQEA